MIRHVLFVEPATDEHRQLRGGLDERVAVTAVSDFPSARVALRQQPPDLLVANLRLGAYNGIHLALEADRLRTRCVVYAAQHDRVLAGHVTASGAFYVRQGHLPFVLPAFVGSPLPASDRRDPAVTDRRHTFRTGRRSTDLPGLYARPQHRIVEMDTWRQRRS
jgi:hypothetical protein